MNSRAWSLVAILGATGGLLVGYACLTAHEQPISPGKVEPTPPSSDENNLATRVTDRLVEEGGWSRRAAQGFWRVNGRRLSEYSTIADDLVSKEIELLVQLHPQGNLLTLLERHPVIAHLILMAWDREALARAILDAPETDQDALVASFTLFIAPDDIRIWTRAVSRHGRSIAALQKRCAALPFHTLFTYDLASPDATAAYSKWLDEILGPDALALSDQEVASRIDFVGSMGGEVQNRLIRSGEFRGIFLTSIWPRFRHCMQELSAEKSGLSVYYLFGNDPAVWDFFERSDAEILFARSGVDAMFLLAGKESLPPDLHPAATLLLQNGQVETAKRFRDFKDSGTFVRVIQRLTPNDWLLYSDVCKRLGSKGSGWQEEAKYLDDLLSADTMRKELHPSDPSPIPGASLVSLCAKRLDGRRINGSDWLGSAFDVLDIVTLGAAALETASVKIAARTALQQTLRTGVEESVEKLASKSVRQMAKDIPDDALSWMGKQALEVLPRETSKTISKLGIVEITTPVQTLFKLSQRAGLGRESFRKLTDLEARVFMRQDGRVFINLGDAVVSRHPVARFVRRTAENAGANSEPIQNALKPGVEEVHRLWEEHLSAWWAGNATRVL